MAKIVGKETRIFVGGTDATSLDWDYGDSVEIDDAQEYLSSLECDVSFSIDWDCHANNLISKYASDHAADIKCFLGPRDRWFFPTELLFRDATFRWDESGTDETVVDVFSKHDTEMVFSNRLARPVFWLWRQWRRLAEWIRWKR